MSPRRTTVHPKFEEFNTLRRDLAYFSGYKLKEEENEVVEEICHFEPEIMSKSFKEALTDLEHLYRNSSNMGYTNLRLEFKAGDEGCGCNSYFSEPAEFRVIGNRPYTEEEKKEVTARREREERKAAAQQAKKKAAKEAKKKKIIEEERKVYERLKAKFEGER